MYFIEVDREYLDEKYSLYNRNFIWATFLFTVTVSFCVLFIIS